MRFSLKELNRENNGLILSYLPDKNITLLVRFVDKFMLTVSGILLS
jgi:hypothetical protein